MSKIETRSLLCPLSDEDFRLRATNLAMARQRARAIEEEKKSAVAKYSAELKSVNETIDNLAQVVKTKSEARPVNVEWIEDHKTGTMRLERLDTNTEIDSRPMTMAERQSTLNFGKKNGAEEKKVDAAGKAKKNGNGKAAKKAETEVPASA